MLTLVEGGHIRQRKERWQKMSVGCPVNKRGKGRQQKGEISKLHRREGGGRNDGNTEEGSG